MTRPLRRFRRRLARALGRAAWTVLAAVALAAGALAYLIWLKGRK